ncbi:MAG: type I-C CRISPR-associated protein Cas5c, partial [Oscillospiraceae bacterium]
AARGILEAVYWHPGLRWRIDKIHVMKPIAFTNIRRNEVSSKLPGTAAKAAILGSTAPLELITSDDIVQRAAMLLTDVRYVIEAHFDLTDKAAPGDNDGKFQDIMKRRLERGQCYHTPCFGCREFPANFRRFEGEPAAAPINADLGYMLYDMDYSDTKNITPIFFRAKLENGVLDLRDCEVVR